MANTSSTLAKVLAAARDTRDMELASGAVAGVGAMFARLFSGREALVVADARTYPVMGRRVGQALREARIVSRPPLVLEDPDLYAEMRFVNQVEDALRGHRAVPVAVGSGTINDLTKLAAHRHGRPYLCVATAASVDGYAAYGASITHHGSKQTFDCPAPVGIVADLDVIAGAPAEMNAWGYADLAAKVTAGADWILADALGVEPLDTGVWDMVQANLHAALADPAGVRSGGREALGSLMGGLLCSGFAMQAHRTSRPASGAEHQFSHLWDMQHHTHHGKAPSHGAKVGIGTLAVTALYEALFRLPLDDLDAGRLAEACPGPEEWVKRAEARFDNGELRAVAVREVEAKTWVSHAEWHRQLAELVANWPQLQQGLSKQLLPLSHLREQLAAAGAATKPAQIGISRERLRESFLSAWYIRRRFTVLDLVVRCGLLEPCLDLVLGPPTASRKESRGDEIRSCPGVFLHDWWDAER